MLTETYEDHWRRYLCAIAIADSNTTETVISLYFQKDSMTEGFVLGGRQQFVPPDTLDIAYALGLSRRLPVEWQVRPDGEGRYAYLPEDTKLLADCHRSVWSAMCIQNRESTIQVTGHPSFQSAAEHLQRLLARKPLAHTEDTP